MIRSQRFFSQCIATRMPNSFAIGTKEKQKKPKGKMPNYKLENSKIQCVRKETIAAFDELLG